MSQCGLRAARRTGVAGVSSGGVVFDSFVLMVSTAGLLYYGLSGISNLPFRQLLEDELVSECPRSASAEAMSTRCAGSGNRFSDPETRSCVR
jgi:hypothetical protein